MKGIILGSIVAVGMLMGSSLYADDNKKVESSLAKPQDLRSQVIDKKGMEAQKAEVKKDEESTPKRPFHHIGHSEN